MKKFSNRALLGFLFLFVVIVISFVFAINNNNASTDDEGGACVISGCSSELCISKEDADKGMGVSICIWSEHFACYKLTKCEKQSNGKCGWSSNAEFNKCMSEDYSPQIIAPE